MTQNETLQQHISKHHKKWGTTDKKGEPGSTVKRQIHEHIF